MPRSLVYCKCYHTNTQSRISEDGLPNWGFVKEGPTSQTHLTRFLVDCTDADDYQTGDFHLSRRELLIPIGGASSRCLHVTVDGYRELLMLTTWTFPYVVPVEDGGRTGASRGEWSRHCSARVPSRSSHYENQ